MNIKDIILDGAKNMKNKIHKINNYDNFDDWIADRLLQEKHGIDEYIQIAIDEYNKDGDEKALLVTLRQAAKAKVGFKNLSKTTGLSRESLYKALSPQGNPRLHTLKLILNALGFKICLQSMLIHNHA